jgi:hypothetical protein
MTLPYVSFVVKIRMTNVAPAMLMLMRPGMKKLPVTSTMLP